MKFDGKVQVQDIPLTGKRRRTENFLKLGIRNDITYVQEQTQMLKSSLATLTLISSLVLAVTSQVPFPLILALATLSVSVLTLFFTPALLMMQRHEKT